MDRTLLNTLIVYTFILSGTWLLGKILLPFLAPVAWALIIGIITFPAYQKLLNLFKQKKPLAAGLMTLVVILLFVLPGIMLVSVLAQEVASLYQFVGTSLNAGNADNFFQKWAANPHLAPYLEKLKSMTTGSSLNLTDSIMANYKEALAKILHVLTSFLTNSFSFIANMVFMLFILFFVYLQGEQSSNWLFKIIPIDCAIQKRVSRVIKNVLTGFIFGTMLTCLVQGFLAGAAYLLLGVPSPLLLAVLTALGGLIPVVGTALIWLPAAIYLYLQGASIKALILVLWGFLAVGMSDNVVKPVFMSSRVKLPILLIMIGAFGGLAAFGVLGAILGPLLLAILYELCVADVSSDTADEVLNLNEQGE